MNCDNLFMIILYPNTLEQEIFLSSNFQYFVLTNNNYQIDLIFSEPFVLLHEQAMFCQTNQLTKLQNI